MLNDNERRVLCNKKEFVSQRILQHLAEAQRLREIELALGITAIIINFITAVIFIISLVIVPPIALLTNILNALVPTVMLFTVIVLIIQLVYHFPRTTEWHRIAASRFTHIKNRIINMIEVGITCGENNREYFLWILREIENIELCYPIERINDLEDNYSNPFDSRSSIASSTDIISNTFSNANGSFSRPMPRTFSTVTSIPPLASNSRYNLPPAAKRNALFEMDKFIVESYNPNL